MAVSLILKAAKQRPITMANTDGRRCQSILSGHFSCHF